MYDAPTEGWLEGGWVGADTGECVGEVGRLLEGVSVLGDIDGEEDTLGEVEGRVVGFTDGAILGLETTNNSGFKT